MREFDSIAILNQILRDEFGVTADDNSNHMTDIFFVNLDDQDNQEGTYNNIYLESPIVIQ